MGNLRSKFGHARPLYSRIIRYVRDGRTDKNNAYCSLIIIIRAELDILAIDILSALQGAVIWQIAVRLLRTVQFLLHFWTSHVIGVQYTTTVQGVQKKQSQLLLA